MSWQTLFFPTLANLIIVTASIAFALYVRRSIPPSASSWARRLLLLGMAIIGGYFLVDLLLYWITPLVSTQAAAEAARDFLLRSVRGPVSLVFVSVTLLGFYIAVRDLSRTTQRAEEASARLHDTLEALPDGLLTLDEHMVVASANPTAEALLGTADRSIVGLQVSEIFYEHDPATPLSSGRLPAKTLTGRRFPAEISCTTAYNNNQLVLVRNVTETAALEAQLRQSQKMESLGRLAGGIAHDFNNYLTVVLGEMELLDPDEPISEESANRIRDAAERAADLTNQLLSFSRKQVLDTTVFAPNQAIEDMGRLLQNLLGKEISLEREHDEQPAQVQVDRAQFEQAIVNLAINARDAMPSGGNLRIEVGNVYLDEAFVAGHPDIGTGDYVMVSITDTGTGISPDIKEHIFEPFYTTKPRGRGTGLGLAMVMGFIKQSHGTIEVESNGQQGTTMRMYLPATHARLVPEAKAGVDFTNLDLRGGGTILVAEDDDSVRAFVVKALTQNGYTVIEFDNANDAVTALTRDVDLLLTDIVMPHGSGYELARRAREQFPDLPVLYMTGYIDYASVGADEPAPYGDTLRKPFSVRELLAAVQENLRVPNPPQANSL